MSIEKILTDAIQGLGFLNVKCIDRVEKGRAASYVLVESELGGELRLLSKAFSKLLEIDSQYDTYLDKYELRITYEDFATEVKQTVQAPDFAAKLKQSYDTLAQESQKHLFDITDNKIFASGVSFVAFGVAMLILAIPFGLGGESTASIVCGVLTAMGLSGGAYVISRSIEITKNGGAGNHLASIEDGNEGMQFILIEEKNLSPDASYTTGKDLVGKRPKEETTVNSQIPTPT